MSKIKIAKNRPEITERLDISTQVFSSLIKSEKVLIEQDNSYVADQDASWRGSVGLHQFGKMMQEHVIVFVESGAMDIALDDYDFRVESGEAVWFLPDCRRSLATAEHFSHARAWRINFSLFENEKCLFFNKRYIHKSDAWQLLSYMQIAAELWHNNPPWRDDEFRSLLNCITLRFFSLPEYADNSERVLDSKKRQEILSFIFDNITEEITPRDLAEKAGMTADYFSRIFKNTFSIPPKTYLVRQRLRYAANLLLESDLSIKEICHTIGETNISKFYRQFRGLFGIPPARYRLSNRG
ncbi:MAG: helix-turn-helix domain-containing protein [Planctomycetota bacterium]|jgi:AraC-like DNA-binding protein